MVDKIHLKNNEEVTEDDLLDWGLNHAKVLEEKRKVLNHYKKENKLLKKLLDSYNIPYEFIVNELEK